MKQELWVYIQLSSGEPDNLSQSLLARAQALAAEADMTLCAVLAGQNVTEPAHRLAAQGVPRVYVSEQPHIQIWEYLPLAQVLEPFVRERQPEIFLFPAADSASLVASILGVRLHTGVNVHCVDTSIRDGIFIGAVPAFGGQVMSEILCPVQKPQMATVRLTGGAFRSGPAGEVISFQGPVGTRPIPKLWGTKRASGDGVALGEASVVVCCGAGMADAEGWQMTKDLAARLGGAPCCTRNALDLQCGSREQEMVGISGQSVSPKVYLGFGVSGSAHHTCGMQGSSLILNVNTDKDNPFFQASDYGYIGDAKAVAQALLDQLEP